MLYTRTAHKTKAAILAAFVAAGGTVFGSCGIADVRHNVIGGTQSFVKGYATDLLAALFPPADTLVHPGGNEDR